MTAAAAFILGLIVGAVLMLAVSKRMKAYDVPRYISPDPPMIDPGVGQP